MKALLIYRDFVSAVKANAALKYWAEISETNTQWDIRPWRVEMLKVAPLADEAIRDALDADMLLFAGNAAVSLPFWLEDWLEQWVAIKYVEQVVLAILPDIDPAISSLSDASQLSQFADRNGLTLIWGGAIGIEEITEVT